MIKFEILFNLSDVTSITDFWKFPLLLSPVQEVNHGTWALWGQNWAVHSELWPWSSGRWMPTNDGQRSRLPSSGCHGWVSDICASRFFPSEACQIISLSMSCLSLVESNHACIWVITRWIHINNNVRKLLRIRRYSNSPPLSIHDGQYGRRPKMRPDSPFYSLEIVLPRLFLTKLDVISVV